MREQIKKNAPWLPIPPESCDIFQPFDCLLCDVLFMAIVDLVSVSRVTITIPKE